MSQWYFILFQSRDHVLTILHFAPIFANMDRRVTHGYMVYLSRLQNGQDESPDVDLH